MNKETAESEKHKNWVLLRNLRDAIKKEKEQLIDEQVEPLLKQAQDIKSKIEIEVSNKYKAEMEVLCKKEKELQSALDDIHKKEAESIWYPQGTLVYLWEKPSYSYKNEKFITKKTGIVHIYDGSQDISPTWRNKPDIGDIIVIHNLQSGKQGKKVDKISNYGELMGYFPTWLAEGDTPTNNIITRKYKIEEIL